MAISLHSGKWTHEESEYVKELIKEFEAGSLNIEENISLRRFLSKALNCSPKRISKKFEGSLYNGKQLYKRKTSTLTPKEIEARRNKLRELEQKYQESLRVLEMVEASRKPGHMQVAIHRNSLTATTKSPLALHTLEAPADNATAAFGLPGVSREARIAQLKADIALASMALESSSTKNKAAQLEVPPRRDSHSLLEHSAHSDILTALSRTAPSLPASVLRVPASSAAFTSAAAVRPPSPSSHQLVAPVDPLQAQLALNQLLLRRTSLLGVQSLPGNIASLCSSTIEPAPTPVLAQLKRGLEPLAQTTPAPASTAYPACKRLKLI